MGFLVFLFVPLQAQNDPPERESEHDIRKFVSNEEGRWDSLVTEFTFSVDPTFRTGFLLNISSGDHFHFLSIRPSDDKIILELRKENTTETESQKKIESEGSMFHGLYYRLAIYHASKVDHEHWRKWKVELTDLTENERILKSLTLR